MVTGYGCGRPASSLPRPTMATPSSWSAEAAAAGHREAAPATATWERAGEGRRRVEDGRALRKWRRTGRALWRSSTMAHSSGEPRIHQRLGPNFKREILVNTP